MRESVSAGCSQLMDDFLCEDQWSAVDDCSAVSFCCVLELCQQLQSSVECNQPMFSGIFSIH